MILEMLTHHLVNPYADKVALIVISVFLCVALPLIVRFKKPKLVFTAVEGLVVFIRDGVIVPCMGEEGVFLTPYFCTLFIFILVANAAGMLPWGKTATGNISVTGGLALTTFLLIIVVGVMKQGPRGFVKTFVPSGTPAWIVPLIFPLEVLGFFTKTFALCIRLFANMIAGHTIIISLIGMIFIFGGINKYLGFGIAVPVVLMNLFINVLEVLVIFIQAYVFTMLTAIFTGAVIEPE